MKRSLILLLCTLLSLSLLGCGKDTGETKDVPTFYYLRSEPDYGSGGSIMGAEERLTSAANAGTEYLLALYLTGPVDDDLRTPFPSGTALLGIAREGGHLTLTMNGAFAKLNGMELTKACACLAMTVFDITDAQLVTIHASDAAGGVTKTLEIPRNSLVLQETVTPNP